MKKTYVNRIHLKNMKNNLHFEFMGSMRDIVVRVGSEIIHIKEPLVKLIEWIANEDEAIDQVRKSDVTGQIADEDQQRDNIFYGMRDEIRSASRHFNPAKREAAHRLDIVFETFKDAPRLELPAESSAIHNLLQELELRRPDVDLLNLGEWMDELRKHNDNVRSLMSQRNSETAARTEYRMKEVRVEVNAAYNDVLSKLESAADLEGEEKYKPLFREMNACVDKYILIMSRGKGGNKGSGDNTGENK